jgi:hypothetical protein
VAANGGAASNRGVARIHRYRYCSTRFVGTQIGLRFVIVQV